MNTLKSYIKNNYGSKRGFIVSSKYYCLHRIGYLRELREVDFSRVRKLVFVCSGNICRSPLAEFYARHLGLQAESYGLHCRGGDPVDARVVQIAGKLNTRIPCHVTRNISDYQPQPVDLVVGMEPSHVSALDSKISQLAQVTLLGLWSEEPSLYLHDPFISTESYFEKCANNIATALDAIKERLNEENAND